MSVEANKNLMRRYVEEVCNRGNLTILEELQVTEYVEHSRQFVSMWRRAFPDFFMEINTLMAEGDMDALGCTTQGTHLGILEGALLPAWFPQPLLPTGRRIEYRGVFFYSIAERKMLRKGHWGILDWIALLRQLGFTVVGDEKGSG